MALAAKDMLPEKIDKRLRTRYRQLPVMLHTAGLAATYAFVLSKRDDSALGTAYRKVADGIRKHIGDRALIGGKTHWRDDFELLEALGRADRPDYSRASAEISALAGWLSRLAEARFRDANADSGAATGGARPSGEGTA
ncbi:type III-B CRISPR module-associated protein Cmr5 [Streptomyces triticisoli]|jgi:CRISPR-associated protein Cmr5|uniref:type III-B CRISPR module-associated protein Cmr5 n=1 Tax=Streptomyces triticisoli TaxID=2182797 RepID=UPI001300456F|nr:type III-B CRISPR module-associated protein Cmr5 [Streptomyces triticisoli]